MTHDGPPRATWWPINPPPCPVSVMRGWLRNVTADRTGSRAEFTVDRTG